jgi:trehalose 6-phosphate phosphatase
VTADPRQPASGGDRAAALRTAIGLAERLLDARPPLLVVSDFDGTLSPIVPEPMGAIIEPIAKRALGRLARLAAARPDRLVVAMLSGRTALDLAGRVRVGGVRYFGNHGVESGALGRRVRAERLAVAVAPELAAFEGPAAALADEVATRLGRPDWLFVEAKGPSVAFHFRAAPDGDAARLALIEAIGGAEQSLGGTGLVQLEGRRIVEVRPQLAGGKGAAAARLIDEVRPGAVLVLGDDVSDAEAFDAVRAARDRGDIEGLAVAVHGAAETPHAVAAAADVELARPRDAARLLSAVAGALERRELRGVPD